MKDFRLSKPFFIFFIRTFTSLNCLNRLLTLEAIRIKTNINAI